jgi:hypothetical protein
MTVFVIASLAALAAVPQDAATKTPRPVATTTSTVATATAVKATQPPRLDGRTDDAIWQDAPKFTGFRQFEPKNDVEPTFQTEFQVAYDEKNLYVIVRMHDPHPDSIMHALTRRDVRGPSDQVKLLIDSYDDKRSGYELAVNPDGVKRDFVMSNDGNEDGSWDGVWDVATAVDSLGWVAEYRIPLSQLRYAPAASHTFGFGVWRDIERYKERSSWPLYATTRSGLSSQLGRLTGLQDITSDRRLEVVPYVVAKNVQTIESPTSFGRENKMEIGGDLKFGITPNITLDATVNPDFGQVEADPAVVNLTAFETFFSERRPFFVEGTGLYRFELNCYIVVDCSTNEGLFYSRRIGRSPVLRGQYGDATTAIATPIAAAAKVTGRTKSGLSYGLLEALTPDVMGTQDRVVEPLTNFAVFRAQQDLRGGESGVSFIATAVNRRLDGLTNPYMHDGAYTGGATFRHRFHSQQYELAGQVAGSFVEGTQASILRTQTNAVHYFQQPGDDLEVDTSRTSLSGDAEQLKFGKYGGGITRFETSIVRQSAGFEVNDLGFLRRADRVDWSTWGALTWRTAKWVYRWAQLNGNHWETWNTSGARLNDDWNFNGHMGLNNNWDIHAGGTISNIRASYCDRCTRGGPLLRESSGFFPWAGVNTDSRKAISGGVWYNGGFFDDGNSTNHSIDPYVNFRLATNLQAELSFGVSKDKIDAQWFGNFPDGAGGVHYSFAHLDQETVSMSMRLNYTMTPNLTFEFYGAPFVSSGDYTNFRETSATPEADDYDDRFMPYTPPANTETAFKFTQLRTNAVFRWEYRPGSTMYVVWQHGRQDSPAANDRRMQQSWSRDYRDLFSAHPNNTFLIKVAYWLNR